MTIRRSPGEVVSTPGCRRPHPARKVVLAPWGVVLIPGGIGDLVLNPHRLATVVTLLILAAIVGTIAWRWPRAVAPVTVALGILLLIDDLHEGRGAGDM